jgi:hypothetical protein
MKGLSVIYNLSYIYVYDVCPDHSVRTI